MSQNVPRIVLGPPPAPEVVSMWIEPPACYDDPARATQYGKTLFSPLPPRKAWWLERLFRKVCICNWR